MTQRQRVLIASLGAMIIGLTAIATLFSARPSGPLPSAATALVVTADDSRFRPTVATVRAEVPIEITLENRGQLRHDFSIDLLQVNLVADAGTSASTTVTFPEGDFEAYCSVPGHRELGMTMRITATAAP